jgi:hypothetical protein
MWWVNAGFWSWHAGIERPRKGGGISYQNRTAGGRFQLTERGGHCIQIDGA